VNGRLLVTMYTAITCDNYINVMLIY